MSGDLGSRKVIISQTNPAGLETSLPRQDFEISDFDALILQKGNDVFHERAIVCPCKIKGGDIKPDCQNCAGTGWVFLDKVKTRMLLSSMNVETKYKEWSEEKMGTVSISCMSKDQISFMDRVTIDQDDSIHTQIIYPQLYKKQLFAYTTYIILETLDVFLFLDTNKKLKRLKVGDDFSFSGNVFILNDKYYKDEVNLRVSIRYRNSVSYHVIDLTRDIRTTFIRNQQTGREEAIRMPLHGIGKRAHYILDADRFSTITLFDNSTGDIVTPSISTNQTC